MLQNENWTKLPVSFLLEHINTCARMHDREEEEEVEKKQNESEIHWRLSHKRMARDQNKCWKIVS